MFYYPIESVQDLHVTDATLSVTKFQHSNYAWLS